ncbi:DUF4062 domain-containing protein [Mucilaginibacter sp. AK015]|uniref:DUF4062 domain-containing protein n=1 Tax=Mucilaginibacter sp. AK015 TaxID=2723072 RepID=UPI0016117622|nr:DUF4062 domain-containing protein [Mucilaginibacter sp. AK015]MBB5397233.1 hypothetical protein [Mucilaginibacter sp. AK015]
MAKPRVFISSTFYDLKQIRADLDLFLDQLGYEPVRNEEGDIPYGKDEALEEYCYKEIKGIDILVCIVGGRFGSESKRSELSISQIEFKTAISENKQIYIFIDQNVLSEYETYLLNKDSEINYRYVDDTRVYSFIEEIKSLSNNNNIKGFETVSDISKYLKEQFAGLFQRFLQEQTRIKEINLIKGLEKTAQTLNKLVNYLSDENKDQAEEINRILTINHPLIESIKQILRIPYNFYFEGLDDVKSLFDAHGFRFTDIAVDIFETYQFIKETTNKHIMVEINVNIFESDGRLKFIRKTDWDDDWVSVDETDIVDEEDDDSLPF